MKYIDSGKYENKCLLSKHSLQMKVCIMSNNNENSSILKLLFFDKIVFHKLISVYIISYKSTSFLYFIKQILYIFCVCVCWAYLFFY